PDRTEADDDGVLAGSDAAGPVDPVDCDGERFCEAPVLQREPVRERMQARNGNGDQLREPAVAHPAGPRRKPDHAAMGRAALAVLALPAWDLRIDEHRITGAERRRAVPGGLDDAGELV